MTLINVVLLHTVCSEVLLAIHL